MRVNTNEDYIPRTLTTNMVVDDKVYIFGGFYGREYNYLKLQNDISSMDMRNYDPGIGKVFVLNEKVGVYGDKTL